MWDEAYRGDGLAIIGVHAPEFAFERVPSNVRTAVRKLGIRYPVALDNDFATWTAYANEYWPAKYLIDRQGRVRYYHYGEGEYDQTGQPIRRYLGEMVTGDAAAVADETPTYGRRRSPTSVTSGLPVSSAASSSPIGLRAIGFRSRGPAPTSSRIRAASASSANGSSLSATRGYGFGSSPAR